MDRNLIEQLIRQLIKRFVRFGQFIGKLIGILIFRQNIGWLFGKLIIKRLKRHGFSVVGRRFIIAKPVVINIIRECFRQRYCVG